MKLSWRGARAIDAELLQSLMDVECGDAAEQKAMPAIRALALAAIASSGSDAGKMDLATRQCRSAGGSRCEHEDIVRAGMKIRNDR
jgi:hypothetical protein